MVAALWAPLLLMKILNEHLSPLPQFLLLKHNHHRTQLPTPPLRQTPSGQLSFHVSSPTSENTSRNTHSTSPITKTQHRNKQIVSRRVLLPIFSRLQSHSRPTRHLPARIRFLPRWPKRSIHCCPSLPDRLSRWQCHEFRSRSAACAMGRTWARSRSWSGFYGNKLD